MTTTRYYYTKLADLQIKMISGLYGDTEQERTAKISEESGSLGDLQSATTYFK
jgi:hypothetical protein